MGQLVYELGPGDDPDAWGRIGDRWTELRRAGDDVAEQERAIEFLQLDLLLAERPEGVLANLPSSTELRADARERGTLLGAYYSGWYCRTLAEGLFAAGRLDAADRVLGWFLEAFKDDSQLLLVAPEVHFVRAEVARRSGDWGKVDKELVACEETLTAIGDPAAMGPDFARGHYAVLSRLRAAQAQVFLEQGLVDRAKEPLDEARKLAGDVGVPSALEAALLVDIDRLLLIESFDRVRDLVGKSRVDPAFGRLAGLLTAVDGLASLELAREGKLPTHEAVELIREALGSDELGIPDRAALQIHLVDALMLDQAGGAASEDGAAQIRESLAAARTLEQQTRGVDDRPLEDAGLLAALEWRYWHPLSCDGDCLGTCDGACEQQADARVRLDRALGNLIGSWASTPPRPGGIGFLHFHARRTRVLSAAIDAALTGTTAEDGHEAALRVLIEVQTLGSQARQLGLAAPSLEQVRSSMLVEGEGCLVFLPAVDTSHLFAFDRQELKHYHLPAVDELQPLVAEAVRARARADGPQGEALSKALFPPDLRDWVTDHSVLTLVGFELMPNLRVAELPGWVGLETGDGERPEALRHRPSSRELGALRAISTQPSLPVGFYLAQRAAVARTLAEQALVLAVNADPQGFSALEVLPFDDEARAELCGPLADRTRLIEAATREDLEDLTGQHHRIVHLFCHGVWDGKEERGAALVLAGEDGPELVHAGDLPALHTDLLILCACGSSRGPVRLGDDQSATLGGTSLARGASCVLVADGRVEYRAALVILGRVTTELAAGSSPAEALRLAIAAEPVAAQRARFSVLGLGHRALFP
ncbi:CHAT domain-containing protein [Engelhardtia mirabilis]|uniref:CHAT domain protein n=1 Tax=Engelhardtia mirabilis TaxID=2528011 RepID=A0A518BEU8_9BACT|nr:CHAT domain protein [Planctomycetes bacterium Pla133]QDU99827.1 CHAT domain protein [Planctomycetes bacterium Pla86]